VVLQVAPDPLVRIQLGTVARESVDLETGMGLEELVHHPRAVAGSIVPEHHDRSSPYVAKEVVEERHHLRASDRLLVDSEVEATRRGHPTDRRELRPSSLMKQYRGLPYRRPGLGGVRDQREATLVREDHYGSSASGFFFIARPRAPAPVLHGSEVFLAGLSAGALPREPVALEEAPHRRRSVADAPLRLGDLEDPRDGPQVGGEPEGERTPSEEVGEGGQLLSRNEGGSTGSWDGVEGHRPSLVDGPVLIAHICWGDPEKASHLGLRLTLREERESLEASFLERGGVTMS
jgi:hypothetical protein